MAAHKKTDRICCAVLILSVLITVLFMNGEALGLTAKAAALGYETRLFDTTKVHTIDIVMDGWDTFIDGCEDEEYTSLTASPIKTSPSAPKETRPSPPSGSSAASVTASSSSLTTMKAAKRITGSTSCA